MRFSAEIIGFCYQTITDYVMDVKFYIRLLSVIFYYNKADHVGNSRSLLGIYILSEVIAIDFIFIRTYFKK